ncbi:serine hydrolase domain-containing protein [Chitinophaga niabensis]|uniref:CubicO group peptidase, beta-lactamase class C family n=1 Tax=Chitinophaga niabensis TaxID=536979 RepID=A0A1N6ET58_9BACT|nr:serine hydrolase [Chitinophaga niabensis]SIN86134.1 CubicO group peptidase, beta-lactamase class C family [Chitinophaga niabensis]
MNKIVFLLLFCSLNAFSQTVLLNNNSKTIPLKDLQHHSIAVISDNSHPLFDSIVAKYAPVTFFHTTGDWNDLNDRLKLYDLLILRLSPQTTFDKALLDFTRERKAIIVLQGDKLAQLNDINTPVLWAPQESDLFSAAQLLFGGIASDNKLPWQFSAKYKKGTGSPVAKIRLGYAGKPLQIDSIATIMEQAIQGKATPGGVVLVVKNGNIVFEQAYGHQTYYGTRAVRTDDLYDLASVTKIAATTPAVMKLYDEGRLSLQDYVSKYVARARTIDDKKDIRIREALLHEAGYTPYIKHFEKLQPSDLSTDSSAQYPVKVADRYYLRAHYFEEVMWPNTLASPVLTRGKFVYSDVSMYMMREVVEKITHRRMNEYLLDSLYLPLGLQTTGFLPRNRFDSTRIVPATENDSWFRTMQVRGYAHDPGAAMAGNVSGHAGLFSDANDLAILYQMFLNKGVYGGERFYKASTIALFTSRQSAVSPRGLGFDRPDPAKQYPSRFASAQSYGHTGYTGTFVWVDPATDMICIILTNRVYPEVIDNVNTLLRMNIRGRILDQVYLAIQKKND